MATTEYFDRAVTRCGYGRISPANHVRGTKIPVGIWLHGIGESGMGSSYKKTLKEAVDFHWWLKTAADRYNIMWLVPQDYTAGLWKGGEVSQMLELAKDLTDGRIMLGGLSMGGLGTLDFWLSSLPDKNLITFYLPLCPGNYEGLNELRAKDTAAPVWIFAGAKDAAVKINTIVNTVDDIRRAGRTENFYLSVFYNEDHYLWNEVMNAQTVPPINSTLGATQWSGTNIVNGQTINVTVPCINDPTVTVYEYFLMQQLSSYKVLPRGAQPAPTPTTPPPITTPTKYFKKYFFTAPGSFLITWSNGDEEPWKIPAGHHLASMYLNHTIDGRLYFVVQTKTDGSIPAIKKVFSKK